MKQLQRPVLNLLIVLSVVVWVFLTDASLVEREAADVGGASKR